MRSPSPSPPTSLSRHALQSVADHEVGV